MTRISSLDAGYVSGQLSLYPEALDDPDSLYIASNNAVTTLKQTLAYNGGTIIVEDASLFPPTGLLRIGTAPEGDGMYELVIYESRTNNTFSKLQRGFAGSRQNVWSANQSFVTLSVGAEMHNASKDAVENMEANFGISFNPSPTSLNGILTAQEVRFLAPKCIFRSFPLSGPPPLTVRFQNFSTGYVIRYLWSFGDGGTSLERSPTHTYLAAGTYTVQLNITTYNGAQGSVSKTNYIDVNPDLTTPFFYVASLTSPYSVQTASSMTLAGNPTQPKEFVFVDQTDGDIVQRNWVFGDGNSDSEDNADVHTTSHIYLTPGEYTVTELIVFSDGLLQKAEIPPITVL